MDVTVSTHTSNIKEELCIHLVPSGEEGKSYTEAKHSDAAGLAAALKVALPVSTLRELGKLLLKEEE